MWLNNNKQFENIWLLIYEEIKIEGENDYHLTFSYFIEKFLHCCLHHKIKTQELFSESYRKL